MNYLKSEPSAKSTLKRSEIKKLKNIKWTTCYFTLLTQGLNLSTSRIKKLMGIHYFRKCLVFKKSSHKPNIKPELVMISLIRNLRHLNRVFCRENLNQLTYCNISIPNLVIWPIRIRMISNSNLDMMLNTWVMSTIF